MRFLVTAGPTREYLDAVRFLSNPSTGRMGFAVASAAVAAGHEASLIAGPVALPAPPGVEVARVTTTQEMRDAVMLRLGSTDAFVAAAAPCDFRPAKRYPGKISKDCAELTLRLVPNPDILYEVGLRKQGRVLIGFALEVQDGRSRGLDKLRRKNLDAIVLNSPAAFGSEETSATLLLADGREEEMARAAKSEVSRRIVQLAEDIWRSRHP
jgi:phosphopantothenoylcysteine decarboxylase/phosphopantothenate--cysteine ligase